MYLKGSGQFVFVKSLQSYADFTSLFPTFWKFYRDRDKGSSQNCFVSTLMMEIQEKSVKKGLLNSKWQSTARPPEYREEGFGERDFPIPFLAMSIDKSRTLNIKCEKVNHFSRLKYFEKAEKLKIENSYGLDMPWGILGSIIMLLNILLMRSQTVSFM